jgi:hypothetical protein
VVEDRREKEWYSFLIIVLVQGAGHAILVEALDEIEIVPEPEQVILVL